MQYYVCIAEVRYTYIRRGVYVCTAVYGYAVGGDEGIGVCTAVCGNAVAKGIGTEGAILFSPLQDLARKIALSFGFERYDITKTRQPLMGIHR